MTTIITLIVGMSCTVLGLSAIAAIFLGSMYDEMNFEFEEPDSIAFDREDRL